MSRVARKRIVLSYHAQKGLKQRRQDGVDEHDIYAACHKASEILVKGVPDPLKLGGFTSKEGIKFDIVVVDKEDYLKVITVIGHKYERKSGRCRQNSYRLPVDMPYKKKMKYLKKLKKESRSWK